MSIVLSPEVERQIDELVRSGRFSSADECIRTSVKLLRDRDDELKQRRAGIQELVEEGARDLEEGRFTVYDDDSLKERIKQIARKGRDEMERQSEAR